MVGTLVAEIVQGPIIPRVEHEGLVAIAALTGTKDQERMQAEQWLESTALVQEIQRLVAPRLTQDLWHS